MSNIKRVKTGFPLLDDILNGGFPKPSSVLIIGPIGTSKNTFAQQFMWQGLLDGEKALYVTVDTPPKDIIENMLNYGWDIRPFIEKRQLVFIDGFSPRVGLEASSHYIIENPFNVDEVLRSIMIAEQEVFGETGGRLVFSHLSTIIFSWNRRDIMKFMERMHAEARKFNGVYLFTYSKGVRGNIIETFIRQLPDVVIMVSKEWIRNKAYMSLWVEKCIKTNYPRIKLHFYFTPKGIVLEKPMH